MIQSSFAKDDDGKAFDCRIVNTSSIWHRHGNIDLDVLRADEATQRKKYPGFRGVYGNSKLAQILHATYLQRVFDEAKVPIVCSSVHPGVILTNIFKIDRQPLLWRFCYMLTYPAWYFGFRSLEQGARGNIYCVTAPTGHQESTWGGHLEPGGYHTNLVPTKPIDKYQQSSDGEHMRKLYEYSLDVLQLSPLSFSELMLVE